MVVALFLCTGNWNAAHRGWYFVHFLKPKKDLYIFSTNFYFLEVMSSFRERGESESFAIGLRIGKRVTFLPLRPLSLSLCVKLLKV